MPVDWSAGIAIGGRAIGASTKPSTARLWRIRRMAKSICTAQVYHGAANLNITISATAPLTLAPGCDGGGKGRRGLMRSCWQWDRLLEIGRIHAFHSALC